MAFKIGEMFSQQARLNSPVHFRGSALPRGHFQSVTPP